MSSTIVNYGITATGADSLADSYGIQPTVRLAMATTVGASTAGVRLPVMKPGQIITFRNTTATSCHVYPCNVGSQINAGGAGATSNVAGTTTVNIVCASVIVTAGAPVVQYYTF